MICRNKDKGFTFIELILYMAILGIFMVAVMSLISTTVASHKKQSSRQKLQSQATETYDAIADILMGASDIKIDGTAYVQTGTSFTQVTGSFIVPEDTYVKSAGSGSALRKQGGVADVIQDIVSDSGVIKKKSNSYDIADVKPFGGAGASEDVHTFIDADYLWVQYSSELDKTAFCTITYSKTDKKLYVFRQEMSDETLNQAKQDLKSSDSAKVNQAQSVLSSCTKYVDASSKKGTVLANNVKSFQLQVNPADNSVAVIIGFEDTKTKETYKVTSVVGLRNSFVLKKHEWD
ncbi:MULTISPECIES: prepilin-type N-terminal cleavage/methylation domain-containing protein [unclassified Coprococcus]|jgi:prepilin-type N-terminal cleavage/methylation domain-containing protein|uniref:prepilin-type N-terminal cleavage/methylation domain-containing protein n=1 Tax=unclassified Coprococcus TaxID=2684943 RepID=UPI000E4DE580|nr:MULTISPECIES: prepilin-type N-terminal cleavage/methylation domain-containing protein [unclassified Coprococcus]RGG98927.1 type II secretion system protein [Coprococcus sp. AF16-22]RHU53607.1 type II secretion system protein [Coprococcus sp. TF11-13]